MIVFAGPTLTESSRNICSVKKFQIVGPVQRGDINHLTKKYNPGQILIADGIFHQRLSVGHREIMDAIAVGWEIHGVSSMGAIRAYELRDYGMHGHGKVFQRFLYGEDFQDDEVALLHLPEPDYRLMSEPMVHFRACLEHLLKEQSISKGQYDKMIIQLKEKYFGDRTMTYFTKLFLEVTDRSLTKLVANFSIYREKEQDLIKFLKNT